MFFLYKEGIYGHGVFWFGDDLEKGKQAADVAANLDSDDYHDWVLYEFVEQHNNDHKSDPEHKKVYEGVRT